MLWHRLRPGAARPVSRSPAALLTATAVVVSVPEVLSRLGLFALLQKNVLDRQAWATRNELRIAIVTWIERTYHRRRRQARPGRLTPIEYEAIMTTPATQAALAAAYGDSNSSRRSKTRRTAFSRTSGG